MAEIKEAGFKLPDMEEGIGTEQEEGLEAPVVSVPSPRLGVIPKREEGQKPEPLSAEKEEMFQRWYSAWSDIMHLSPDPDDHKHEYNYRDCYMAGYDPEINEEDARFHFPSQFKSDTHPNRYVKGIDTKTGLKAIRLKGIWAE